MDGEEESKIGEQQILDLEEQKDNDEFQLDSQANYMSIRNRKIEKVAQAMGTVHTMYKTLGDIVDK